MKSYDEIADEVKKFIAEKLQFPSHDITTQSSISDLATDSIQLFELLLAFEQRYQFQTAYDDVVGLETVDDVTRYVAKHKYQLTA